MQVTDSDLNSLSSIQTINVLMSVFNGTSVSTTSLLALREISISSSIFTGSVQLCRNCSGSGFLSVGSSRNRTVCATYTDSSHQMESCNASCDFTGHCSYTCAKVTALRTSCSSISVLGLLTVQPFVSNASNLTIALDDADLNTADIVTTTNVTIISYQGSSQSANQTVSLTKTGVLASTFTAKFMLNRVSNVQGCAYSSSGVCCGLGASSKIMIVYNDRNPSTQVLLNQYVVCVGTFGVSSYFVSGNNLAVRRMLVFTTKCFPARPPPPPSPAFFFLQNELLLKLIFFCLK